ncbi:MAG TPA: MFS transporter [Thermoanaerobaculia bacterium]|nr:MFS transporter [Thermoanaerobaculia bacterium]
MFRTVAATYREAFSGLSRSVWLLSLASLINRAGTMVMPFLVLFLVEKRGFTTTQAGQTLALYGFAAMAASYYGGRLCDRFGPLRVMQGSLVLTGLSFWALGLVPGRLAISAMVLVLALVGEVFRPANLSALTVASDPGERARSIALMRLAVNAGMTVGPSVGGLLAAFGYGWLFLVDGATSILAAGLLFFAFPEARAAAPVSRAKELAPARSPFRDLPVMAILGLMFLLSVVVFQVTSTFPLSLRDLYGFSEARIGVALASNTVIIVLFEMVLIHSLARRDPLKVAGFGAFLFGAGLALLPFGSGLGYAVFTVAIWTVGEMLAFPLLTSAIASRAPEGARGAYLGLLNFSFAAGFVVAPLVGTWVYQHLGARTLWLGCGVMGVVVWAGLYAVAAGVGRPAAVAEPQTGM